MVMIASSLAEEPVMVKMVPGMDGWRTGAISLTNADQIQTDSSNSQHQQLNYNSLREQPNLTRRGHREAGSEAGNVGTEIGTRVGGGRWANYLNNTHTRMYPIATEPTAASMLLSADTPRVAASVFLNLSQ